MQVRFQNQTAAVAKNARRGFNLLEILVVVAIVVMLAGMGSFYVFREYERSQEKLAHTRAIAIAGAIKSWEMDNSPEPFPGLQALTQGNDPRLKPDEALDPWGQPYQISNENGIWVVATQHKGMAINNVAPPRR